MESVFLNDGSFGSRGGFSDRLDATHGARSAFLSPGFRDLSSALEVIHNENQLMVVIAVQYFDVHAGFGHAAREQSELARDVLLESANDDFSFLDYPDAGCFERGSGSRAVGEKEVSDSCALGNPGPAPFDAHAGAGPGPHPSRPKRLDGFPGRLIGLSLFHLVCVELKV